uniref:Uncharacterized protein n=2 Tax=Aegilops tauschii subsp. strangulata TaxID=200361 RepID=A0A453S796_AEGTS
PTANPYLSPPHRKPLLPSPSRSPPCRLPISSTGEPFLTASPPPRPSMASPAPLHQHPWPPPRPSSPHRHPNPSLLLPDAPLAPGLHPLRPDQSGAAPTLGREGRSPLRGRTGRGGDGSASPRSSPSSTVSKSLLQGALCAGVRRRS